MPKREGVFVPMEGLPRAVRVVHDHEFQAYWYAHVSQFVVGKRVLDAGAGMGYGRRIMNAAGALSVASFDLVSLVPWVVAGKIFDYPEASFDWVVAMDVIEHVEDDVEFLLHAMHVSREAVFFATPNWNVFHAQNEHHRREYTPAELRALVALMPHQEVRYWSGDEHCAITERPSGIPDDDMCCNFGVLLTSRPLSRRDGSCGED